MKHPPGALVVVDLQQDYFRAPSLSRLRPRLVQRVRRAAEAARAAGAPVIEVRTENARHPSTWALNMREDGQPVALAGSDGAAPLPELDLRPDHVVVKTRDSAYHHTTLGLVLDSHHNDAYALCGVTTESCIAATATDGYAHDHRVSILVDCVASDVPAQLEPTLERLSRLYRQEGVRADRVQFRPPQARPTPVTDCRGATLHTGLPPTDRLEDEPCAPT
ncbi:isochorismatase family protein [Aeromicrobium marinum DSM 15272]|uniref:Isochorismatase family protein n=1 Tax=Aeromicrobium marinum DSM 15272 TaxID=585531 RepID=E2S7V0_9ACTN|nr:isochorismatase family cysteine hydrolase [Aeromicrobium marinum]EFQ84766.1 isochorismatase family protein [Aeromicrobium marinum DSM 15272]